MKKDKIELSDLSQNTLQVERSAYLGETSILGRTSLAPSGSYYCPSVARDHMAQSSMPRTPLRVALFWESGANPPTE